MSETERYQEKMMLLMVTLVIISAITLAMTIAGTYSFMQWITSKRVTATVEDLQKGVNLDGAGEFHTVTYRYTYQGKKYQSHTNVPSFEGYAKGMKKEILIAEDCPDRIINIIQIKGFFKVEILGLIASIIVGIYTIVQQVKMAKVIGQSDRKEV